MFSWVKPAPKAQTTKICCAFLRTGFRSSDRRQYFGSVLRDVGVTSLIIIRAARLSSRGAPDRLSLPLTGRTCVCLIHSISPEKTPTHTLSRSKMFSSVSGNG
jgi:hypothetical protein